jgi:hypothetical protein
MTMTFVGRRLGIVLLAILVAAASILHAQVKPGGARITADPLPNWGATYHALEQKTGRVKTRFADGSALAERGGDGEIRTWLYNAAGFEIATLQAKPAGDMQLDASGADSMTAARRPGVIPTLSWANEQARALLNAHGSVEWRGELLRGREEPAVQGIEAEFEGNLLAKTIRYSDYYGTSLFLDGARVGRMTYHPKRRELAFDFPGLTKGLFTQESLKRIGGWRFTPTMAWMNIQALAFYQFHSAVKAKQAVRADWLIRPQPNWFWKAWEAVFPTVYAQDGCTDLHYLDNTIYRPCCDRHDACYAKSGCDRYSWLWPFGGSWSCVPCNVVAVMCFLGVGHETDGHIWYPTP